MVIAQGDIWWAELPEPFGSESGYRRPVLVIQCDRFNESNIATILSVPLTGQLKWANFPGNILLTSRATGLQRDSVANVSQIVPVDRRRLIERAGRVAEAKLQQVLDGVCLVIGR